MQSQIKLIFISVLSIFLLCLILLGIQLITASANNGGNSSTIAGVDIGGLEHDEVVTKLQNAINSWVNDPIVITGAGQDLSLDASTLQFDIEKTVKEYDKLVDKPWYAFWQSKKVVHVPLVLGENETLKSQIATIQVWDTEATYNMVQTQASFLRSHKIEAQANDVALLENERISLAVEELPENAQGIEGIIEVLNQKVIKPGEIFSFNQTIGERANLSNNETLSFFASIIYDGVLQTEYEIVERSPYEELTSNFQIGREALVSSLLNKDLKFKNTSNHGALVKVSLEGRSIKLEIFSDRSEKEVFVQVDKEYISPRIIYRYSNDLAAGGEQLLQKGVQGIRVNVFRSITENGSTTEELISRDYYAPVNRIVLKSSREPKNANGTTSSADELEPSVLESDTDLNIDIDGDGLPDMEMEKPLDDNELPPGSYYDKGGNLVTP